MHFFSSKIGNYFPWINMTISMLKSPINLFAEGKKNVNLTLFTKRKKKIEHGKLYLAWKNLPVLFFCLIDLMCFQHHKTHTVEKQCSLITTVSATFITMRAIQEWHSNHNLLCKTRNKTYGEKKFDCKVSVTTNKVTYTINVLLFRKLKYEMNLRFFFPSSSKHNQHILST